MKRTALLPLLLVAALATVAQGTKFAPWKGSTVKINGTSTVHEWEMSGSQIDGKIEMPADLTTNATVEGWKNAATPTVTVSIPVKSIKSEHSKMDSIMADALKADKFPAIKYELLKIALVKPGTSTFVVGSHGKLTIAGVTKEVDMNVTATRGTDNRLAISGELPIKMTDYGIKPPTAMLGTIKAGDAVKVSFRWVVEETH